MEQRGGQQFTTPAPGCVPAGLGFGKGISPHSCRGLAVSSHREHVTADTVIWHDELRVSKVGIVLEGYLRFQRYGRDGRRQILNLTVPGDLFGHESLGQTGYTLEAATDVVLCCFDRNTFDRLLCEDRSLRHALYRHRAAQIERLRWLTWTIGVLRPDERLVAFLLNATGFMPFQPMPDGGGILTVAISRRDIADLLATTTETLCRVLKGLEREGILEMIDPARIRLFDRDTLAARAALPADEAWALGSSGLFGPTDNLPRRDGAAPTR